MVKLDVRTGGHKQETDILIGSGYDGFMSESACQVHRHSPSKFEKKITLYNISS